MSCSTCVEVAVLSFWSAQFAQRATSLCGWRLAAEGDLASAGLLLRRERSGGAGSACDALRAGDAAPQGRAARGTGECDGAECTGNRGGCLSSCGLHGMEWFCVHVNGRCLGLCEICLSLHWTVRGINNATDPFDLHTRTQHILKCKAQQETRDQWRARL